MPEDIFIKRFGTTRAEMEKCAIVDESAVEEVEKTISECDVVILAHENGEKAAVAASVGSVGASAGSAATLAAPKKLKAKAADPWAGWGEAAPEPEAGDGDGDGDGDGGEGGALDDATLAALGL